MVMGGIKGSIAVCVTTHNRYDVFKDSYTKIKQMLPDKAALIVVDDASDVPVKEATYRFDTNVGIAAAKNKCLELAEAEGYNDIFLFDDDTYPIHRDWYKPYFESKEPHLMYIFPDWANPDSPRLNDCHELYRDDKIVAYSQTRGCMLYIRGNALKKVGGMDTRFGKAMNEHTAWSNRIFNAGLTSFRYMDVPGSDKLFYSADEHQAVSSSIKHEDRVAGLTKNKVLALDSLKSTEYIEYRESPANNDTSNQNNIVLTSYFIGKPDPQRNLTWTADFKRLTPLIDSCNSFGHPVDVLSDCFGDGQYKIINNTLDINSSLNPYFQRYLSQYQYLRDHPEIDNVFIVDATDVEMLKDPFPHLEEGKIYVGDEPKTLMDSWMLANHPHEPIASFLRRNGRKPLLNCGIIGGSRDHVMEICHDIIGFYVDNGMKETLEMGTFNYIMYSKWAHRIFHGAPVNTRFKAFDYDNEICCWRHK